MIYTVLKYSSVFIALLTAVAWFFSPRQHDGFYRITATQPLSLSRQQAWEILRDLRLAHHYVPGIRRTQLIGEQNEGIGASRRVYQRNDQYLIETVVAWQQGQGFSLALRQPQGKAPFPFKQAYFDYQLRDVGSSSEMAVELRYQMSGGFMGYWLHRFMLSAILEQRVARIAARLKRFYEQRSASTR